MTHSTRRRRPPSPPRDDSPVGAFDTALKYLLHRRPADFSRFALASPHLRILRPIEGTLPARGRREVDGGYLIELERQVWVSHTEFHRRHQDLAELALDIGEVQLRLYRRERVPVLSQVWDLYGNPEGKVLEDCELVVGPPQAGTRVGYRRVNLRALPLERFLAEAPAPLWPLSPLTRDGAGMAAAVRARDAIAGQEGVSAAERADRLAILWFMAEAEGVAGAMLREFLSKEKLMESELYRSIIQEGKAEGLKEGARQSAKQTITRILARRLGYLDEAVAARIAAEENQLALEAWLEEALGAVDEASAQRLVEQIRKAPRAG